MKLTGPGMDRLRLPVFWFGPAQEVLPAFGSFTSGLQVRPYRNDRLYAVAADTVVPLEKNHKKIFVR